MEKVIITYKDRPGMAPFHDAALDYRALARRVGPLCHAFNMHVRGEPVETPLLAPEMYDAALSCVCAVWLNGADEIPGLLPALESLGHPHGIYLVTEATARDYPAVTWPLIDESPGVTLFASMRRKPEHSIDDFAQRWLVHARISLRIHPLVRYLRNLTLRRLAGDDYWDGFTEERVASIADLQLERFCPNPNDFQMSYEDMQGFLLLPQGIQCAFLREHILKLPSWLK